MHFGYTIVYVSDVAATVAFYERAFGLRRRFVHDSGSYAEMDTGTTTLAFAGNVLAQANGLPIRPNTAEGAAPGIELCLVSDRPLEAHAHAVAAGASAVSPVATKPWGQQVGYVRDPDGVLVEICSPIAVTGTP